MQGYDHRRAKSREYKALLGQKIYRRPKLSVSMADKNIRICMGILRWPRSAPRIQITHSEFGTLTPNSKRSHRKRNHSHRIRITHRIRIRNTHTQFKSLTPNSKHSHRIRNTHTEIETPTPNSKSLTPNSEHSHQIRNAHLMNIPTNMKYWILHCKYEYLSRNLLPQKN